MNTLEHNQLESSVRRIVLESKYAKWQDTQTQLILGTPKPTKRKKIQEQKDNDGKQTKSSNDDSFPQFRLVS